MSSRVSSWWLLILVFGSGVAALVYQVMWMRQLGLLFGNTSQAAGVTLAAFFLGLALGSAWWGRGVAGGAQPLRLYARLELGIAATALLYFVVLALYHRVYPFLYQQLESPVALGAVKFLLALLLVVPPSFCMGGTLPVMGELAVRSRDALGHTAAWLYGVNTLGAMTGALVAGFYLPLHLGFRLTYVVAIGLTLSVAAVAFRLSRGLVHIPPVASDTAASAPAPSDRSGRATVLAVGFLSGFGVLALEVVWTRMFSQVVENSVYTYATILVVVLACLALGALVSSGLARAGWSPRLVLGCLLLLGGAAVALTPFLFLQATDHFQILGSREEWSGYVWMIVGKAFATLAPSALLLGAVFPYLMKVEEPYSRSAGHSIGRLAAVNTAGAILGSLACAFLFLEGWGMWGTIRVIAVLYLLAAVLLPAGGGFEGWTLRGVAGLVLAFCLFGLNPSRWPTVSTDPDRPYEEVLETWEASSSTVAVTRNPDGAITIRVNSHYGLGSSTTLQSQQLLTELPMYIHPQAKSLFFLGLGTGITAGTALQPKFDHVEQVVACELVPEVVTAARKYMTDVNGEDLTHGLFTDPRATVLAEDGRHHLMATDEQYDLIIADLFVPFRRGVGSLYSREHFSSVRERLEPGGMFVQWLPMYQLTSDEFHIISRTMLEAFDQVSLWRGHFNPGEDLLALVGHQGAEPLPASNLDSRPAMEQALAGRGFRDLMHLALPITEQSILLFYAGNLSEARDLFDDYPVNTDDHPHIEYGAPRSYREPNEEGYAWFIGPRIMQLVGQVQERCPPMTDPLLAQRESAYRRLPAAGHAFYQCRLWMLAGFEDQSREQWQHFVDGWLDR